MGTSSENLVGYVTSSSSPNIPLIFTMKKIDGSIVLSLKIDNEKIGDIVPPS